MYPYPVLDHRAQGGGGRVLWDSCALGGTDLVETNDVGMPQHLHDLHLPEYLLEILIVQLSLIHYLYGHLQAETEGETEETEAEGAMERESDMREGNRGMNK